MSDHDLRDLLREQVADVTTYDLSARAWSASRGIRRRRARAVVSGAAASTVLVVAGIAMLGDRSAGRFDTAPPRSPEPTGQVTAPDGQFRGVPVFWSPSVSEEARLPVMESARPPLPEVIDLSAEATPVEDDPIDRAVAAFGVIDDEDSVRLVLLAPDGTYRSLDLADVGPDPTLSCCRRPAVFDEMLSPTGEYIVFPQTDGLMVYDLPRREWRAMPGGSVDPWQATWTGDREFYDPQSTGGPGPAYDVVTGERTGVNVELDPGGNALDLEGATSHQFGPARRGPGGVLQTYGSGARLPVPDGRPQPEFLVVNGEPATILTFTGSPGGGDRWLQCCPVVGWAGTDVAMYESRSGTPRIIAWTVGTRRFETVSSIIGFTPGEQSYVGSYASNRG